MTARDFRRIALGMKGSVEGQHMAHPDFRANGRIFATLSSDPGWGCIVRLTPEQQRELVESDRETFVPAKGAWGRAGATMVRLESAEGDTVGEAMTLAWQGTVKAAKPAAKTARSARKPR
jgi:hypothetical protein